MPRTGDTLITVQVRVPAPRAGPEVAALFRRWVERNGLTVERLAVTPAGPPSGKPRTPED